MPGSRVRVSLGRARAVGVIVAHAAHSQLSPERLRPIGELLDTAPLFAPELLDLLQWTASYYHHPPGEVFASALPAALRAGQPLRARELWLSLTAEGREAAANNLPPRAPRQRELLSLLSQRTERLEHGRARWDSGRLAKRCAFPAAARMAGISSNAKPPAAICRRSRRDQCARAEAIPELSAPQVAAVSSIDAASDSYGAFLLQGVTGSGKTEVYLRLVQRALARGRGALVLVPEIGLTPQLLERFRSRLAVPIAVLHSALSDAERLANWRSAHAGTARVVIGTRSAVFAPIPSSGPHRRG